MLPTTGTLVKIFDLKTVKDHCVLFPDNFFLICQGLCRIQCSDYEELENYVDFDKRNISEPQNIGHMLNVEYPATIRPLPDSEEDAQLKKFGRQLNDCVVDMAILNDSARDNFLQNIMRHENIRDLDILSDWVASITTCDNSKLQKVLDTYHLVDLVKYSLFLIKVELAALRTLNIRRFVLENQLKVEDDKSNDDIQKF